MSRTQPRDVPAIRLEVENEWAWCGDRRLELAPREFALLRYLVEHPGRLVTKDELLRAVWGDTVVSEAALTSCIRDLRRALADSSRAPHFIETAHRRGFRFIGRVVTATTPSRALPARPGAAVAPVASRPLIVGREAELARLHEAFEAAVAGRRQLVFVTGEPGIGKTALVETFLGRLDADGPARIGRGQCVEQYGAGEAYLPVLEALGRLGREARGEEVVRVLRQYAPTWLVQLPALLADGDVEAVRRRAQGATRERMLRESIEAIDEIARDIPLVLLLEDLHWSDSATVGLLGMLARRRDPARVLILATYRPADVAADHPLASVQRELGVHGQCEEIALEFLSEAAVREYLDGRFPRASFPPRLARALHRNTSGNPLFLVNVVDDLVRQGHLRAVDGCWEVAVPMAAVAAGVPRTLRQLVERQIERLTPEEQAVLVVGCVAGAEFSAALAASDGIAVYDAERWCAALARRRQLIRAAGVAEWPDGTVAGRYAFIHALYQNVLYARVPIGRRVGLHLRIGARLEQAHGPRAGEIAGELAMHFEHGRDFERAFTYRRQAAQTALRHRGYREAADHARRALALVDAFPESPTRIEHELVAHVQLGTALTAMEGWGAPEAARTFAHVHALCMRLGPIPQTFPVLFALSRFYVSRGELPRVREVAEHLSRMADAPGDTATRLGAYNASGVAMFYGGDFVPALERLERGIAIYDPARHAGDRLPVPRTGDEVGVSCALHAAWALWMLGYPDRAATRMRQALGWASAIDSPFTRVFACHVAAAFHYCRGERDIVRELEDEAGRLSTEHAFGLLGDVDAIYRGWLEVEEGRDGRGEDAIARMRAALAGYRAKGAELQRPTFLGVLADVIHRFGRSEEGLALLTEELAAPGRSLCYWDADLHRWKGEFELACGKQADAETSFRQAREVAQRQQAKAFELRAAVSLSRLWQRQGRTNEALTLLSDVYGWFTEGFDTGDLRAARALLDALSRQSPSG